MAAAYFAAGKSGRATFELFVRELPKTRNYLIAAGLGPALDYLEGLQFSNEDLRHLRSLEIFDDEFLSYLAGMRFSGDVWAFAEGEAVFAQEPLIRVTAPLIEAQIVETVLLNCVGYSTSVASKASRIAKVCRGRPFADFSLRRDHGADAAMLAARSAYIGGAASTSNVLAGREYGLEISGTMAHSFVQSFDSEIDAFVAFGRLFPDSAVFLIDTYDTIKGAAAASEAANKLGLEGIDVKAVRIDSGDLGALSGDVRKILDEGGQGGVLIFASGDLDEYQIDELVSTGSHIDGFGVGTRLGVVDDAPALSVAYKLVEDERGPTRKLSPGKESLGGVKQVYRFSKDGRYEHDLVALASQDSPESAVALLDKVMESGGRVAESPSLEESRRRCESARSALPAQYHSLNETSVFPVELSALVRLPG